MSSTVSIVLHCDTDARDTITLARIGGCVALTTRAKGGQVNLTPADARKAAAWLVLLGDEIEASLARVREQRLLDLHEMAVSGIVAPEVTP